MRLSELKNYTGTDAYLKTSLYEYGLVWHKTKSKNEYRFIYGVRINNEGNYDLFDYAHMDLEDYTTMIHEDWFDLNAVEQFAGGKLEFPLDVFTCLQYHGYENIFGGSYYPFEIKTR